MKKYLSIVLLALFIIPSVVLASWWNPFSWKIFQKQEVYSESKIQKIEDKTSEEKILDLQKQLDDLKGSKVDLSKEIKTVKKNTINNPVEKSTITIESQDYNFISLSDVGRLQESNFSAISYLEKLINNIDSMNDTLVRTLYISSGSSKKVGEDTITLLIKAKTSINHEITAREQMTVLLQDMVKAIKIKDKIIYDRVFKNINELSDKVNVLKEDSILKYNEASNSFNAYDSFFEQ